MCRYKHKSNLAWKKLGDHTLVLDNGNKKMAYHLDDVGTFLWNELEKPTTKDLLLKRLLDSYDIDEETANRDIDMFFSSLLDLSLIEIVND